MPPQRSHMDKIPQIRAMLGKGMTKAEIGRQLGMPVSTLNLYIALIEGEQEEAPAIPDHAYEEMKQAAGVEDDDEYDAPEQVWKREERRAGNELRKLRERSTLKWTAPGKHVLLSFISDMHIGGLCDYKQMREDAEMIRDTPGCYAILGGDQVDNHIKHKSAMINGEMRPERQYQMFEYYLKILADKCLIIISGNHDDWTFGHAGVDVLGRIARAGRIFYSPNEAWLDLTVGGQTYTIAMRHQYRLNSSFNQTHSVKQWLRLGHREFDIGCIGHHHEAAIEQVIYRNRFRWVCRPGSYQVTSGYSDALGYDHAIPTCPTFLIHGNRKEITGYKSIRAMRESVTALRDLGAV